MICGVRRFRKELYWGGGHNFATVMPLLEHFWASILSSLGFVGELSRRILIVGLGPMMWYLRLRF